MNWIKYSEFNIPLQGLKILSFNRVDMYVAQVFKYKGKDYWIPIPFADSYLAKEHTEPPEYWTQVELPQGYGGYMKVSVERSLLMTIDQYEQLYPEKHEEFVLTIIQSVGKTIKPMRKRSGMD